VELYLHPSPAFMVCISSIIPIIIFTHTKQNKS
jgi:hypothetical protein